MIYPDNTMRNWQSFEGKVTGIGSESLLTLCDPQTSGGLLVCVDANHAAEFERKVNEQKLSLRTFGKLIDKAPAHITILD
jgi:selenide,water dikinase